MAKERHRLCSRCKSGKVFTDELRRGFNAKSDEGRQICPDCKVKEIYERFGL